MKTFRGILRFAFMLYMLLVFIFAYLVSSIFYGFKTVPQRALGFFRAYVKFIKPFVGLKISVLGNVPNKPVLLCANHCSYIDPLLICHNVKARAVAKLEISKWPIMGWGAKLGGVLFVKRGSIKSGVAITEQIVTTIKNGESVLIFPEGTTNTLPQTIPFKKGGFAKAAQHNLPVVPVSITYSHEDDAWGDQTMFNHFIGCFGKRHVKVKVHYGEPVINSDTKQLLNACRDAIDAKLLELKSASW